MATVVIRSNVLDTWFLKTTFEHWHRQRVLFPQFSECIGATVTYVRIAVITKPRMCFCICVDNVWIWALCSVQSSVIEAGCHLERESAASVDQEGRGPTFYHQLTHHMNSCMPLLSVCLRVNY